jgi:hypothetical protein
MRFDKNRVDDESYRVDGDICPVGLDVTVVLLLKKLT